MRLFNRLAKVILVVLVFASTFIAVPVLAHKVNSPSNSVAVYNKSAAYAGYTLIAPINSKKTYLINNKGQLIHTWQSNYYPGVSVSLLENGDLLRSTQISPSTFKIGGAGGGVEMLDWKSKQVWSDTYISDDHTQHHDAEIMPNGHVLMLAWDLEPKDAALAAGVNPANLSKSANNTYAESVIEVDPSSNTTVWQWHTWGHLVQDFDSSKTNYGAVSAHPELINANYYQYNAAPDWMHANSVDYNPKLDQILVSVREFNEVWIIDHSTTTQQAASHSNGASGHGGDLLYRWGNPQAYNSGTATDRTLFLQHNANWIKDGLSGAGDILIFNNGDTTRPYSTVEQISTPVNGSNYTRDEKNTYTQTTKTAWHYEAADKSSFYGAYIGGAQRLPNGDTFITQGPQGRLFEINPAGKIVWEFDSPISLPSLTVPNTMAKDIFRSYKYPLNYPGLKGKDLTSKGKLTAQS